MCIRKMNKNNLGKKMKLHIFNPEHDIALAANQQRFTAPHAGRQMRADLGFIPALWAEDGDLVLVDDVESALEALRHIGRYAHDVTFVTLAELKALHLEDVLKCSIEPWGWDRTIKEQLLCADDSLEGLLPDDIKMRNIRMMSSRRFASDHLLPKLREMNAGTVGESCFCTEYSDVANKMSQYGKSVLKAPWSSSGRGVRYVQKSCPDEYISGWVRNVIARQGGIMIEPFYTGVYDFGMEFEALPNGNIRYCGLSLFATRGGAYIGSICATENDKREILSRYVDLHLLDNVKEHIQQILSPLMTGVYDGVFGVDMMAVVNAFGEGFLLHPCVELNLRRTMGHVALALTPTEFEPRRLMSIYFADKYRIRVQTTTENLLNTGLI